MLAPLTLLGSLAFPLPQDTPPNLIVFLTDQHNAHMLGEDTNGFGGLAQSLTPTLDQIAAEGLRFPRAYTCVQQCVPARVSILTGRYPHHHGTRWNHIWETRTDLKFPELARRFGYATGNVGKHHFHWLDQDPTVEDHGFDFVLDMEDYFDYCQANGKPGYSHAGNYWSMSGIPGALGPTGFTFNSNDFHPSGYFANRSIEFIDAHAGPAGDGKPFVLWCSFQGPHAPILPSGPAAPQDWAHMYHPWSALDLPPNIDKVADMLRLQIMQANYSSMTPDQHREVLSYYYGYVSQIDFNVGRVLDRLEQLGVDDNTVVLFTSDHGELASEMSVWTKGGGAYESLTRVPLLLRAPGLPQGSISPLVTDSVDVFPTLVELLGLTLEPWERALLDGRSLVGPVIEGGVPADWRQAAFAVFGNPLNTRHLSIITPVDKYTFDEIRGDAEEYFDLVTDRWEIVNRVGDPLYDAQVCALRDRFDAWWNDEEGHAPYYRVTGPEHSPPVKAHDPQPASGTNKIPRDVDPEWLPATSADTQEVWSGTTPDQLQLVAVLPHMADHYNPGVLLPNQAYYWRVDGANGNGVTQGDVWMFRTAATPGGPDLASTPAPSNGSMDVPRTTALTWSVGTGVASQDVWLGAEGSDLQRVAAGLAPNISSFQPPPLDAGVSYRWRIDGFDASGAAVGSVWTFDVDGSGLPALASGPVPAHLAGEIGIPLGGTLRWKAGQGAIEHDVYFGTELPPTYRGRQTATQFAPGPLEIDQTYYWRIDEVNAEGVRTGFTWRFRSKRGS